MRILRQIKTPMIFLTLLASLLAHQAAFAQWQLDNDNSSLYYVSSKSSAVSEINHFTQLSGYIKETGEAELQIDLSSVETAVEIRNQRVREILFQVSIFSQASANLQVDSRALTNLTLGETMQGSYSFSLNLHGIEKQLEAELSVTKLDNNQLQIQLIKPLIISAQDFNLAEGITELKDIAGLPSINNNVIIDLSLLFVQK